MVKHDRFRFGVDHSDGFVDNLFQKYGKVKPHGKPWNR